MDRGVIIGFVQKKVLMILSEISTDLAKFLIIDFQEDKTIRRVPDLLGNYVFGCQWSVEILLNIIVDSDDPELSELASESLITLTTAVWTNYDM